MFRILLTCGGAIVLFGSYFLSEVSLPAFSAKVKQLASSISITGDSEKQQAALVQEHGRNQDEDLTPDPCEKVTKLDIPLDCSGISAQGNPCGSTIYCCQMEVEVGKVGYYSKGCTRGTKDDVGPGGGWTGKQPHFKGSCTIKPCNQCKIYSGPWPCPDEDLETNSYPCGCGNCLEWKSYAFSPEPLVCQAGTEETIPLPKEVQQKIDQSI